MYTFFVRWEALFCLPQTCRAVFGFCFLLRTWSCTFRFYPSLAYYTLLLCTQNYCQSESSPSTVQCHAVVWGWPPCSLTSLSLISSSLYLFSQNPSRKKGEEVWHGLFILFEICLPKECVCGSPLLQITA